MVRKPQAKPSKEKLEIILPDMPDHIKVVAKRTKPSVTPPEAIEDSNPILEVVLREEVSRRPRDVVQTNATERLRPEPLKKEAFTDKQRASVITTLKNVAARKPETSKEPESVKRVEHLKQHTPAKLKKVKLRPTVVKTGESKTTTPKAEQPLKVRTEFIPKLVDLGVASKKELTKVSNPLPKLPAIREASVATYSIININAADRVTAPVVALEIPRLDMEPLLKDTPTLNTARSKRILKPQLVPTYAAETSIQQSHETMQKEQLEFKNIIKAKLEIAPPETIAEITTSSEIIEDLVEQFGLLEQQNAPPHCGETIVQKIEAVCFEILVNLGIEASDENIQNLLVTFVSNEQMHRIQAISHQELDEQGTKERLIDYDLQGLSVKQSLGKDESETGYSMAALAIRTTATELWRPRLFSPFT